MSKSVGHPEFDYPENQKYAPIVHTYTEEQRSAHASVKNALGEVPEWLDDALIYRFLRSVLFDEPAAIKLLKAHIEWRRTWVAWPAERISATPEARSGVIALLPDPDYWGRPVIYARPRYVFPAVRTPEDCEQVFISTIEKAADTARRYNVEECVLILDLTGWGLRNRDSATMKMQVDHLNNNFPDALGRAFVIHYPYVLWPVWNVIKGWLKPAVRDRVTFIEKGNSEELLNVLPHSALPSPCGGDWEPPAPLEDFWALKAERDKGKGWFGGWFGGGDKGAKQAQQSSEETPEEPDYDAMSPEERKKALEELERKTQAEMQAEIDASASTQK